MSDRYVSNKYKTKVIAFCLAEIPSATIGVISVLKSLCEEGQIEFYFKESINITAEDLCWADIIVPIRSCEPLEYQIIKEARRLGKYIIYFLDDHLLGLPETAGCATYFNEKIIRESMLNIMRSCHCLWAVNPNIKHEYGQFFEKTILMRAPILVEPYDNTNKKHNEKIRIGFAGSIDHKDFVNRMLGGVVRGLLEQHGDNIEIEFIGCRPDFIDKYKEVKYTPYMDSYTKYRDYIISRNWDIGLAPLPYGDFHKCKYYNKYLEYGSMGICGIYSDVEPLKFIVKDKKNGLLVKNEENEWIRVINEVINNYQLRKDVILRSYEQLKNEFNAKAIGKQLIDLEPQIVMYEAKSIKLKDVQLSMPVKNRYMYKVVNMFIVYKWRAPWYICRKVFKKIKEKLLKKIIKRR